MTAGMLAFVLDDSPALKEVPIPELRPDEALVRVLMAGICGTDLELLAGYRGFRGVPGHEMVGVVEKASDASWIGKRVVSEINLVCHECSMCSEGLERHCQKRQVMGIDGHDGCFAEFLATPIENLHAVPESVTDEEAVWTEPLAAALGVWKLGIGPGDRVLVLGDGRLGSLIALGLQWRGAAVEIAGRHEEKLKLLESLGLSVMTGEPRAIYPCVVEATGSPAGLAAARAWTRPRGTIVLKSTCHEPVSIDTSRVVVDELRLVGSRCGDFGPAIEALATKAVPVGRLVSEVLPFQEMERALRESAKPETFKILLDFRANS